MLAEAGSHPVSGSLGWGTANDFVKNLERVIEEEASKIRETELPSLSTFSKAWLMVKPLGDKKNRKIKFSVVVDKLGRIHVPEPCSRCDIKEISLDNKVFKKVIRTEERWNGNELATLVCYLEET